MILAITFVVVTGISGRIGKSELIETPPEWRSHGVETVKVLNRDSDDGEVEIVGRSATLLLIKTEGVFLACKDAAAPELCKQSLASSALATFIRIDSTRTALFLFSDDNRPDLGSFWMVLLDASGKPYPALHLSAFQLIGIRSDSAGILMVGKKTLSEACCAADATTYDPYSVYTLGNHPGAVAEFSLKASEEYNRENYVWAGPEYRKDILVQQHPGTRPKIIPNPDKSH